MVPCTRVRRYQQEIHACADTCSPKAAQRQQGNSRGLASSPGALAPSAFTGHCHPTVDTNAAAVFPTTQQLLVSSVAGGAEALASDQGGWPFSGTRPLLVSHRMYSDCV